jgi:NAD(P)-dependent dehydrogenase (short-subunit alcohol dehydrogenase family)
MKSLLENKTVVVIGGSSGMGLAVAENASRSGARVVIASRSQDKLAAAAGRIGGDVHWQVAYLKMPDAAREGMFDSIAQRLPVGRVGRPEDIADAAAMLMTNGFITGASWMWMAVRVLMRHPVLIACPPSLCLTSSST